MVYALIFSMLFYTFLSNSLNMKLELLENTCILVAKKKPENDKWSPLYRYHDSLLDYEDIRLSENALTLIENVWKYITLQTQ